MNTSRMASSAFCLALTATAVRGQSHSTTTALPLTASLAGATQSGADAPIVLSLSRSLTPEEGELALFVAGVDVTAVSDRSPSRISYRPVAIDVPAGESEIVLYRRVGEHWTELRRFVTRFRQGVGGAVGTAEKSATLGNTGQLAQGQSAGISSSDRRTFQDFVLNAGTRSSREGKDWSFGTQSNFVGVSRRQQALRFATQGHRAPMLDLSDYTLSGRFSDLRASVGHVNFGESRHLASGITSRGAALSIDHGSTSIRAGAMSGAAELGWSDISGLERPANRMFAGSIGHEIVASRPGALRLDATVLRGSKQPTTSFTQSAVVDAQRSLGSSVQLTAALPNQRLRAVAGYSRSRFENPNNDPQLRADSSDRRPKPATRGARFVDLSAALLQNAGAPGGPASLSIGVRDERVDPLYGSVGATGVAADRRSDAVDATLSWGAVTGQFTTSAGRDNLGHVPSILTTDNRASTASLAMPLAALAHFTGRQLWFPTLTGTFNRTHQFADGVPTNGQFRPTDLPNQVSAAADVALAWQVDRYRLTLRGNRSAQDNRQELREQADFEAGVLALSLGANLGARGDVSVDLGNEYQLAKEHDERTTTRRVTVNSSLVPRSGTGVVAALSVLHTRRPIGAATLNSEGRLELSQGIGLRSSGEQRGQVFLRYARTVSLVPDPAFGALAPFIRAMRQQWTLASGLNVRLF